MYSYEIEEYLKQRNYYLRINELIFITDVKQHPQIDHLKYNAFGDYFEMWTNDGYYFKFEYEHYQPKTKRRYYGKDKES